MINIWYLDEKYLNDLYDQMIGTSIFSLKRREEEVKESEHSAGGMLSKIVFPIGIELRKRYSIDQKVITEKTISTSVYEKITEVEKRLSRKYELKELISKDEVKSYLVWIDDRFYLQELYYCGKKDKNLIHEIDFIEKPEELTWILYGFVKVDNSKREYEESSELIKDVIFEMRLGGEKLQRNIKHITRAIEKYHPFDFNVIGDMEKINNCTYSIKPIVIYKEMRLFEERL